MILKLFGFNIFFINLININIKNYYFLILINHKSLGYFKSIYHLREGTCCLLLYSSLLLNIFLEALISYLWFILNCNLYLMFFFSVTHLSLSCDFIIFINFSIKMLYNLFKFHHQFHNSSFLIFSPIKNYFISSKTISN